jgi:hypothetical protein
MNFTLVNKYIYKSPPLLIDETYLGKEVKGFIKLSGFILILIQVLKQ